MRSGPGLQPRAGAPARAARHPGAAKCLTPSCIRVVARNRAQDCTPRRDRPPSGQLGKEETVMRGVRVAALGVAGLLLAGCGTDAMDIQLPWSDAGQPETERFEQAGVDAEARQADLEACVDSARAQVERDQRIDESTELGTTGTTSASGQTTELRQRMEAFGYEQRLNRLIADCMERKGYTVTEAAGE
jgi:hypothetical protein